MQKILKQTKDNNSDLKYSAGANSHELSIPGTVSICKLPQYAVFTHSRWDGQPIDLNHKYAIAILIEKYFIFLEINRIPIANNNNKKRNYTRFTSHRPFGVKQQK